ncbi:MAG TPA: hypothetical protein EYG51_08170 [Pseudomonadales bacterium]|nr:hypothetical protein [Pseudomonadales bacterium]
MRITKRRLRRIIRETLGGLEALNPRSREIDAAFRERYKARQSRSKTPAHASAVIAALVKLDIVTPVDQAQVLRDIAAAIEKGS